MNTPDLQQIGELITDGERFRALCRMGREFQIPPDADLAKMRQAIDVYRGLEYQVEQIETARSEQYECVR
jgi:hypothetical protein